MGKVTFNWFRSNKPFKRVNFFKYKIHYSIDVTNKYSAIAKLIYENGYGIFYICDKGYLYLKKEIDTTSNKEVSLEFIEETTDVPMIVNEKYIKHFILERLLRCNELSTKYYKSDGSMDILSYSIFDPSKKAYITVESDYVKLCRKFKIDLFIDEEGYINIIPITSCGYKYMGTIYDLMQKNIDVIGMSVKGKKVKGVITGLGKGIEETSFQTNGKETFLLEYFKNTDPKEYEKIIKYKNLEDMKCIIVKKGNASLSCVPCLFEPILSTELLSKIDEKAIKKFDSYHKINMSKRFLVVEKLIEDIDKITGLGLKENFICDIDKFGYNSGEFSKTKLKGKTGSIQNKVQIFTNGYYKLPKENIKFSFIYNNGDMQIAKKSARALLNYLKTGDIDKREANNNKMNIAFNDKGGNFIECDLNNRLECKEIIRKCKENGSNLVIVIEPSRESTEIYSTIKKECAKVDMASQFLTRETAIKICDKYDGKYYLPNIAFNVLGKAGGVTWILNNKLDDIDLFIGLDVGRDLKTNISYPASSAVFTGNGEFLGYYKPESQKGEKIKEEILIDSLDNIILNYKKFYEKYPKHVVIHRDGFSNEDINFYEKYFENINCKYSLIEVKKTIKYRMLDYDKEIENPKSGAYIYKGNEGFIVTSSIKIGAPSPLHIVLKKGYLPFKSYLKHIYDLSNLHVGALKDLRLPITTGYADKICKNREYIPSNKFSTNLYFL